MSLEWAFKVSDDMTAPLKAIDASLGTFEKNLHGVEGEIAKLEKAMKMRDIASQADPLKKAQMNLKLLSEEMKNAEKLAAKSASAAPKVDVAVPKADPFKAVDISAKNYKDTLKDLEKEIKKAEKAMAMEAIAAQADPLKKSHMQLKLLHGELEKTPFYARNLSSLKPSLAAVGTAALAAAAAVAALGAAFVVLAIKSSDAKRSGIMAIEAAGMTKQAAEETYDSLQLMARGTKQTTEQMLQDYKRLSQAGYGVKASQDIIAAAADVQAVQGDSAKEALLDALSNMKEVGHVDPRALMGLKQVGAAGPEKFIAVLAEQHHTTAEGVKKLLEAGKISAQEGQEALLSLVQKNLDGGGALGTKSMKIADGDVDTQIKNLKEKFVDMFEDVDTGPVVAALKQLGTMFSGSSKDGVAMKKLMNQLFGDIAKVVSLLPKLIGPLTAAFEVIEFVFSAFADVVPLVCNSIVDGIAATIGGVVGAFDWIKNTASSVVGFFSDFGTKFMAIGGSIVDGLINGIKAKWDAAVDTVKGLGKAVIHGAMHALDAHSPSRAMMKVGGYASDGFRMGVEGGDAPELKSPVVGALDMPKLNTPNFGGSASFGSMPSPSFASTPKLGMGADVMTSQAAASGSQGGKGGVTIGDINVHVEGGASGSKDLGQDIADKVRAEIVRYVEGIAFES